MALSAGLRRHTSGNQYNPGPVNLPRFAASNQSQASLSSLPRRIVEEPIVPPVRTIHCDDPVEFAGAVNGLEARYLPTTNDHRFTRLELLLPSGHLAISTRPPMLYEGTVVAPEGVVCFHLEDSLWANVNGHSVSADTIALWKTGTDYRAHQQCRITHCALFVSNPFSAHDWPEQPPIERFMWTEAERSSHLRASVRQVAELIRKDPARLVNPNVVKGIDQSIVGSIDDALSSIVLSPNNVATGRYIAICRRAEEYLRESGTHVHSSLEVAKACGVNMRTLHNALISVLGMSLGRYLMLRRLWLARRALLRAGPEDLVKSIALDYGFWHLGRFSRIYHREFGELPSETLGRCRSAR